MELKYKISIVVLFFFVSLSAQENFFPFRDGKLWGICNEKATILVEPKYDTIKRLKEKGFDLFEAELKKNKGVFKGSKNIIPVEFKSLYYLSENFIIALKEDSNQKEISYLYDTKGNLLINQPLSFINGFKGKDHYGNGFIIGFYIKDLQGKESLLNIDIYNNYQINYLIKDVFSIKLDAKNSKEELAIAYVKKTAESTTETKYFKVEGSKIILLDQKKDSQHIAENSGTKKSKYDNYDNNVAVPYMDTEVIEEPRIFSSVKAESNELPTREKKQTIYENYTYLLNENLLEIGISNNTIKNKKTIKFPFKTDKLEVLKMNRPFTDEKIISETKKTYYNYIIYQRKNKFGLVYQFPFEKSTEYDFLEPMKSEKKYDSSAKNYFKVGFLNKKTNTMKFGIIDINHNFILPAEFDEIKMGYSLSSDNNQVFLVKKNNLFGLISDKMETKLPIEFDKIEFNSENQSFLKVKKGNQHSAYISYYSNSNYITQLLPTYFPYEVNDLRYSYGAGKKANSLLETIEYITLEDENGKFKGYANPNGTLYFKD